MFIFSTAGWGWHIETAIHVLRIILGGTLDRYPELQLIVGHMGEGLPFMQSRADIMTPAITGLKRPISAYLRENVHYTFSGFNYTSTFLDLFLQVGVDRIMFSADHPYGSMAKRALFRITCRSAPPIENASRMAMRNASSDCRHSPTTALVPDTQ